MYAVSQMSLLRRLAKRVARRLLLALLFALFTVLGLISATGRLFRRRTAIRPDDVHEILVIRLDLLGDLVMSLPAVHALKQTYGNSRVTVLALPYAAGLIALAPEVDRVLSYDVNVIRRPRDLLRWSNYRDFFALVGLLRRDRYDLCLSLHGPFACVMAWLTGCPRRYGYAKEAYPFMLTHRLPGRRYDFRQHEVLYDLKLAELAGTQLPPSNELPAAAAPRLTVPVREQRQMRHLLAEFEIRPETVLVVVHPGASNGSAKRWLSEYWANVANRLHGELGTAVIITGTPAEAEVVREVEKQCSFRPIVMAGQTTIPQLGALLKRADLLLSGDTAPAHMAAALGTPVVSIFGPTDPLIYRPLAGHGVVLRTELWCSPCYDARATAECRFGHVNCMRQLLPEQVYQASVQMLQKRLEQVKP